MLENTKFGELGDPVGVVFVQRNRLVNYAATRDCYRCARPPSTRKLGFRPIVAIFFQNRSQNSLENRPKQGLEWSDGAETLPITTTIERNNWAKSEDDLSTLRRRTKEFQYLF